MQPLSMSRRTATMITSLVLVVGQLAVAGCSAPPRVRPETLGAPVTSSPPAPRTALAPLSGSRLPAGFQLVSDEPVGGGSPFRVRTYATRQYARAIGSADAKKNGLGPVVVVREGTTEPTPRGSKRTTVNGKLGKLAVVDGKYDLLAVERTQGVWVQVVGNNAPAGLVQKFAVAVLS